MHFGVYLECVKTRNGNNDTWEASTRKVVAMKLWEFLYQILVMSHAKLLAKEIASGAAEMKSPVRKANSSRR